ncbi:DUF4129 domain-containing protein [Natrononativus amylolyticus]|uniref:DUF4129 domain-containing protein n=1 Tax=Natrononativus amylolyticus TaxID=2963434 RepID=UPI0020CDF362|nr:DUF4129 domain-containing protein [Natrononativus amylolyticus]
MDRDTLLTLSLALCCTVALGTAATALESSVSTEPGDVIDLDYESLPISTGEAEELRDQYEGGPSESSSESSDSSGAGPTESLLDRLLELLAALFDLLLRALPVLIALAAVAALVRRRRAVVDRLRTSDDRAAAPESLVDGEPNDAVARAWYEMVRRLDLEERREKTPREFESEAIDRGADPEAVADLTRTFEDVRYGEYAPTEDRTRRVSAALGRLLGRESGDGGDSRERNADAAQPAAGEHAVRSDGGDRR